MSEPEPIFFSSPQEFYDWLEEHHESEAEVYVGYYKTHTGKRGMTWSEAVDQALCFGWIDTRTNSIWSKINVEKMARLTEAGLMRPAGLAAFERRTDEKTGVYSFEREHAELPAEYEEQLRANSAAAEYFDARPPWYRRTATHWVVSAKREETRLRRLAQLIEDSAKGLDVKPLRRP
jgi:uncharacterized protein YdeI (YjbR/CyaY-like superfamily)